MLLIYWIEFCKISPYYPLTSRKYMMRLFLIICHSWNWQILCSFYLNESDKSVINYTDIFKSPAYFICYFCVSYYINFHSYLCYFLYCNYFLFNLKLFLRFLKQKLFICFRLFFYNNLMLTFLHKYYFIRIFMYISQIFVLFLFWFNSKYVLIYLFFITVLLMYNSHTIQFTYVHYTIQLF